MTLVINGLEGPAPEIKFVDLSGPRKERSPQQYQRPFRLASAFWRGVPHWNVPPAFSDPGKALAELGVTAYKEAVKQYYEQLTQTGVERAQRTHSKWAVRQVLRAFETHIRGFRRQDVGARGGIFTVASDELVQPEQLWANGRLVADLQGIIRQYQVREDLREAAVRLVRAKLRRLWGLR